MKISLIIPVINEADQILNAIEAAWATGVDEVIVVDGGSDDNTFSLAASSQCIALQSAPGRAAQMNFGAANSSGEILLFLHADNRLASGSAEQIRAALQVPSRVHGGFRQRINHTSSIYRLFEWGNSQRILWQGLIYGDQAMFVRKTAFESAGRFPEIPLMEDWELSRRLYKHARPVLLVGPTTVSARRWERHGPLRQTCKNWYLTLAYRLGASPMWLARQYRRHDR